MTTTKPTGAELLEQMLLARAFEERNAAACAAGTGKGTCTSVGQEASAVGVVRALAPHDLILTNHRSAAHLLARGADPDRLMAEIQGKAAGYCKGKSGNLHVSAKELGVILTSTIVGGELSLATGVGLSLSMRETDAIVACFFGDGAAAEGVFHEALNLAAVWSLPVLFVCENNQWQAFVHRSETMVGDHIAPRAAGYGVDHRTVDGNDADLVYEAAAEAVAAVRATRRPFLLETYTYRLRGHFEPDDQSYVDPAEIAAWKRRDPIDVLSMRLLRSGALAEPDLRAMRERAEARVEAAFAFAQSAPYPDLSELTTDVWA